MSMLLPRRLTGRTTPTGVPFIHCWVCNGSHPEPREHCIACARPSAFINAQHLCLTCNTEES